ncbi:hypothetical protein D3C75_1248460 [compost metagenome]
MPGLGQIVAATDHQRLLQPILNLFHQIDTRTGDLEPAQTGVGFVTQLPLGAGNTAQALKLAVILLLHSPPLGQRRLIGKLAEGGKTALLPFDKHQ